MNRSKKKVRRSRSTSSLYGPPPIAKPALSPFVCSITRNSNGLKKRVKEVAFEKPKGESNAFLGMKVGEFNMLKRLKNTEYLRSWQSKKQMYTLCEEKYVSKLQRRLFDYKNGRGTRSVM